MAGDLLGGIGLGLQKGVQFMQNKDVQDQAMASQRARDAQAAEQHRQMTKLRESQEGRAGESHSQLAKLRESQEGRASELHGVNMGLFRNREGRAQDTHGVQMQLAEEQRKERENAEKLVGVYRNYANKNMRDPTVADAFYAEANPFMSRAQLDLMQQTRQALDKQFGAEAVDRLYYENDLGGIQAAADVKFPGSKVSQENGKYYLQMPDQDGVPGEKKEIATVEGLAMVLSIQGAAERSQALKSGALEAKKTQAVINKDQALANKRNAEAVGKITGGGKGGGKDKAGATAPGGVANFEATDPKTFKELNDIAAQQIGDGGLPVTGEDGDTTYVDAYTARTKTVQYAHDLMASNSEHIAAPEAYALAQSMVQAENGDVAAAKVATVRDVLDPDSGEWVKRVMDGKGASWLISSVGAGPADPVERETQEAAFVEDKIQSGDAKTLETLVHKSPKLTEKLVRAVSGDRQAQQELNQQQPGIVGTFRLLYTRTGLGALYVDNPALRKERMDFLAESKRADAAVAAKDAGNTGGGEDASPRVKPEWTPEERAAAANAGVTIGGTDVDVPKVARQAGRLAVGGLRHIGVLDSDSGIKREIDRFRNDRLGSAEAHRRLIVALEKNPQMLKTLSEADRRRLEFKADQRIGAK